MPDLKDIKNPVVGTDARSLIVQFANEQGSVSLPFNDLSDGEKCFMICALVLAGNEAYGPMFVMDPVFWTGSLSERAALKMKENQCHELARTTHRA
jgi:hypothetical protein